MQMQECVHPCNRTVKQLSATDKQKIGAKTVGKLPATEKQKLAAKDSAKLVGKLAATAKQKAPVVASRTA